MNSPQIPVSLQEESQLLRPTPFLKFLNSPPCEAQSSPNSSSVIKSLIYHNEHANPLKPVSLLSYQASSEVAEELSSIQTLDLLNYYKIKSAKEQNKESCIKSYLTFDSKFESGNLWKAFQYKDNEFVLLIRPDYNNSNYSHWFYFSVVSEILGDITFHIANIQKKDAALLQGMQIVAKRQKEWKRTGKNMRFTENSKFLEYTEGVKAYSLTFTYEFTDSKKTYFAYSYPYTYADLNKMIKEVAIKNERLCRISKLCTTLGNLGCPIVTITDNIEQFEKNESETLKKIIFFIGRIHPSESPSSYIMKGLIGYLLNSSVEAESLRKNFVFKIVPMINPDGVKHGNSRCSLLGVDLNRRWISPHKLLYPELYSMKELVKSLKENYEIAMFCDVHSHAKKRNVFMYGCNSVKTDKLTKQKNSQAKLIPVLLSKSNSHFSLKDSHFKMNKAKEGTARIVMFKEFGIVNSYTIETSFFGSEYQRIFEIQDWESIGCDLAKTCLHMTQPVIVHTSLNLDLEWAKAKKKGKKQFYLTPKPKAKKMKSPDSQIIKPKLANESSLPNLQIQELKKLKNGKLKQISNYVKLKIERIGENGDLLKSERRPIHLGKGKEVELDRYKGENFYKKNSRQNSHDSLRESSKLPYIRS